MASTKTYLITGVSSGIGLDLCKLITEKHPDATVIGTVRQRQGSLTQNDEISKIQLSKSGGKKLIILEGIDVSDDDVGNRLLDKLKDHGIGIDTACGGIDYVIHNAGSVNGTRSVNDNCMDEQNLTNVSMERMRAAFEVNTLGPLKIQQALLAAASDVNSSLYMIPNKSKIAIISTGLASISDNSSGGTYAYRTSKAAVNMVGRCLAMDLKKQEKNIPVALIAPGFIATDFGPGYEKMESWGAKPVRQASEGILEILDEKLNMENTGAFWCVQTKDGKVGEMGW